MDENEIDITVTRESGTGRTYLRFSKTTFNDAGIETSRRNGFKELKKGTDPAKALAWAKERKWRFGTQNRQNGQYEVVEDVASEVAESNELVHDNA